jgi:hypothetical protein
VKFIRILTFFNLQEAHLVAGRLKNEGIECFLKNENFGTLMPHYANILGSGIDLMIKEADMEDVKGLLKDYFEPKNDICPACGSINIKSGLGKNKNSKWFLVIISLIAALPFGNIKLKNNCKDCKTEF